MGEEEKASFQTRLPDVDEYPKELMLSFEKEVLGVYVSGHPLEEYMDRWKKNITAVTTDFALDEESGAAKVHDGESVVIGGMITGKTIKYTKNNKVMAFLQIEDLLGTVEVVVFPNVYERSGEVLQEDAKIFISGHADVGDDRAGKLICDRIIPFDAGRKELWIQFPESGGLPGTGAGAADDACRQRRKRSGGALRGGREEREAPPRRTKCKCRSGIDWKIGKKFR